ncbi:MAG TPA: NAD-dependent epimerase/dehydratase family protein, partial [Bacteroidales bacterium]|nr:NAD-dependent epimerase/dehydratase family protein [Bacteroidales bacterium]
MKKIAVCGAGGFIAGHLVKELLKKGHPVRAVDIKPLNEWYQVFNGAESLVLDLQIRENCYQAVNRYNQVFNLAADMGGMGFIENNKAACMISVLINTHL